MREEEGTNARSRDWSIREATHAEWKIQDGSTGLEHQGKVWSVRGSIKGRRRRRHEEKARRAGTRARSGAE